MATRKISPKRPPSLAQLADNVVREVVQRVLQQIPAQHRQAPIPRTVAGCGSSSAPGAGSSNGLSRERRSSAASARKADCPGTPKLRRLPMGRRSGFYLGWRDARKMACFDLCLARNAIQARLLMALREQSARHGTHEALNKSLGRLPCGCCNSGRHWMGNHTEARAATLSQTAVGM